MDNDAKVVKLLKNNIKKIRFKIEYLNKNVLSEEEGNNLLKSIIQSNEPKAVVRFGSVETNCMYPWLINKEPDEKALQRGMLQAGIFPPDAAHNAEFSAIYSKGIQDADVVALCDVYKERKIVNLLCPNVEFIRARSIEPYYFEDPWTALLKEKRVLIVHPFIDSIKKQYNRRETIFPNSDILPKFGSIEYVKAVQSNAGASPEFEKWADALEFMKKEIAAKDFDIAIVGAGAYALPLCTYIKQIGKIAIQMSGATQLFFGIKGKRWDNHPVISKLYNENWIRPNDMETPAHKEKVEGGSYW